MAEDDPTRGDVGDGYRHDGKRVERRSGDERRKGWFVTCREWKARNRRVTTAFVFLVAVSCVATYLGYNAGRQSDRNLRESGADAALRSCLSRADIRITTADALDDIRASALRADTPKPQRVAFFERTQSPINKLLGLVAGHPVLIVGRLPSVYLEALRHSAELRCAAAVKVQFKVEHIDGKH